MKTMIGVKFVFPRADKSPPSALMDILDGYFDVSDYLPMENLETYDDTLYQLCLYN